MKTKRLVFAFLFCLTAFQLAYSAPEYISNFASFPAYPYNTAAYKQGGAFVGCGPTTGAMMFGYFQAVYSLTDLLTSPGTGVNTGLNTAWALHGSTYMNTGADGFGNVLNIKPGLENYAAAKGYTLKVMIHVSPTYTSPNTTFDAYGPYGNAWTNDASFFQQKADGTWKIDPATFCNFLEPFLDNGVPIFLTIDSDGNGGGDHWVALVGFDRSTWKYAFYDTYSTTLQWADIYYVLDSSGHKVNSISYLRTVALSLPDIASNPAAGSYGSVTVGSYQEKTFTISNAGTAVLNVTATALTGTNASEFSIRSGGGAFTLAAGSTRNIVVRFTPSSAGAKSASLNISSNDPDESPFGINLSGTGTATAPDIASNAASYSYGSLNVGSAREFIFIISNAGGSSLNVTATTITGTNASEFVIPSGGGAFTLSAGATHNIVVRFVPASAGDKTASLSIASNDPDENPFVINLDGNGIAPDIAANPTGGNFGSVVLGGYQERTFSVYNIGSANLNVTGVTLTGANASEFSIRSGGGSFSQAVGATARNIVVRFTPATAGSKIASLSISSNDPDENPFLINLIASGIAPAPDIAANTASWSYGSVSVGNAKENTFVISNAGNADLVVTTTTITGTHASEFSISSGGGTFTLAPGSTRNLAVRFIPATEGNKSAALSITSNDPDENPFLINLVANGIGPDIAISPFFWDFGKVTLGGHSEKTFVLSNTGRADLIVSAVTITGTDSAYFSIQSGGGSFTLAADSSRNVVVRFNHDKAGSKSASLRIESNDPDENPFTAALLGNVYYITLPIPDITCSPASWDFGAVQLGSRSGKTFTVSNKGDGNLNVSSVTLTGTNASEFSIESGGGAFTLAPAAVRDIKVLFSPASAGGKTAILTFSSNDPNENPFLVNLTGSGTSTLVDEDMTAIPNKFHLDQNYPNPFNPVTTICYSLPTPSEIRLAVYNAAGRLVAVLAEGKQPAGEHRVTFDGKSLNSGIYFYKLEADTRILTQKMILLK